MNVTTEYLAISGLKIPKYIQKLSTLRTIMNIPNGVVSAAPPGVDTLVIIRYMIPAKLRSTPPAFWNEIGSLITIAAVIIV